MSHPKEYVTTGALMQCSEGTAPMLFKATPRTTKIGGFKAGNEADILPLQNIPSFLICKKLTQMANGVPTPCVPAPTVWTDTYEAKVGGARALLKMSCMQCTAGQGKIEFITSGQAPLPPDVVAEMQSAQKESKEALDKAQQEKDSVGEAGFAEGLIPIWGSGRDLIHAAQTGDGWGIALNAGFLVWDVVSVVAGAFSFGTATAAMMAGKAGVRTALKAAGKVVLSSAKKQGAELLAKSAKVFKGLGPKIVDFTQGLACKLLKACFPAGTPIAVKGGYKNIEDIEVGDLVWSWDETTGDIGLKPVTAVMEKTAEALIEITSGSETIRATPKNPFWVGEAETGSWKNADELTEDDELWLLDKRNKSILSLDLQPQEKPVTVYNFEVAEWHTYFVGIWMMLVHNAPACINKVLREIAAGKKKLRLIMLGKTPGKSSKTGKEVFDRMVKDGKAKVLDTGQKIFEDSKGVWHDISKADMSHIEDAVKWWNRKGYKYGARSTEVRKWMLKSKNYVLDHFSLNRSAGGAVKDTYRLPLK